MHLIMLTHFPQITMINIRGPSVHMRDIETRCWIQFNMHQRISVDISDKELQELWLYLMYTMLTISVHDKFESTDDLLTIVRKRSFVDTM